ncbi:MAG: HNH endonuclease [Planctomycetota bacterium]
MLQLLADTTRLQEGFKAAEKSLERFRAQMPRHKKYCTIHRRKYTGRCPECSQHREADAKKRERIRGSAASRLYGHQWRVEREAFLKRPENRNCYYCLRKTKPRKRTPTVVDHFIPHRGDLRLFWDKTNWRPSCKQCHDRKTATHDGGFGRTANQRS